MSACDYRFAWNVVGTGILAANFAATECCNSLATTAQRSPRAAVARGVWVEVGWGGFCERYGLLRMMSMPFASVVSRR